MLTNEEFSELTYMLSSGQGLKRGAASHAQQLVEEFSRRNPQASSALRQRIASSGLDPRHAGNNLVTFLNRGGSPPVSQAQPFPPAPVKSSPSPGIDFQSKVFRPQPLTPISLDPLYQLGGARTRLRTR